LVREQIFKPSLIAQFADRDWPDLASATVGNYRTRLMAVTKALNPTVIEPGRTAIPPSQGVAPYTEAEEEDLWIWAHAQSDDRKRRDAILLLAGCLGAGLTAREVSDLHGRDITVDHDGVVLHVGAPRVRDVPVMQRYEKVFVEASQDTPADGFVFLPHRARTSKNTASGFIARSTPSRTVVSTQRLRATWLIRHMARGVRVDALMSAMGVGDFSAIARYLQYVPDVGYQEYRDSLRANGHTA